MQTNVSLNKTRKETLLFGLLFGVIAALIILGYGAARGFQVSLRTGNGSGWLMGLAFIVMPLLAGLLATFRSGRIGSGPLAGLLAGLLGGLGAAAYILIIFFTSSSVNTAIQTVQNQLNQSGASFTISSSTVHTFAIVAAIIVALIFLAFGTLFGLIGAVIGKILQPRLKFR